ncbi:MAG: hypothetical protein ACFFDP_13595, partial [Promethearchaeota archaeon]
ATAYVDNDVFVKQAIEWLLNGSLTEVDVYGPEISQVTLTPTIPVGGQSITISAMVTDNAGVDNVTLYYQVNGGTEQSVSMTAQGGDSYEATIPASVVVELNNITYQIKAYDQLGNWKKIMPVTLVVPSSQLIQLLIMITIAVVIVVIIILVVYLIMRRRKGKAI